MNRYTGLVLGGGSGTYCVYRYTLALGTGIYKINLIFLANLNVGGGGGGEGKRESNDEKQKKWNWRRETWWKIGFKRGK